MDAEIFQVEPARRHFSRSASLPIVDSHVHIWAPHSAQRPWPRPEKAKPHKAYLGAEQYGMTKQMLVAAMDTAGVDRAILIPPSWEGHYNDLALDALKSYPGRFAIMGRVLLEQPMGEQEFNHWRTANCLSGIRCIFHSPRYQASLLNGDFDWIWPLAERNQVPVALMLPGMANAASFIRSLLERFPALKISLDHLNIQDADTTQVDEQVQQFLALAQFPNFALKVSAVPTWSKESYPFSDTELHLKKIYDAFGPKRLFWGSDFTRLAVNYRSAVCQFTEDMDWLSQSDLQWIMGRGICEWLEWR